MGGRDWYELNIGLRAETPVLEAVRQVLLASFLTTHRAYTEANRIQPGT